MCINTKKEDHALCPPMAGSFKNLFFELLHCIIVQIHWLFDCVVDFVFGLIYDSKAKKVPPVKNPLLLESAISLAEKIRNKKVTSENVVKSFIDRCEEVNAIINAITEERYAEAIKEAKAVDKLIESGINPEEIKKLKPFLGIPFTTKESNEVKGMLHTLGLLSRKDYQSPRDATVVAYLKEAGGILIATTNVPELNLWMESRNNLYGQTGNPYNNTRTAGGSSGGEGAIIAACGSAISIGSDIGGSTRMPAFYNGVFGHKPSENLASLKGVGLRQKDFPNSMAQAGPICKRAEDLAPLLKVLIGDKVSLLKLDENVDLSKLNIFYQEGSGDLKASKMSKTMKDTMKKAVRHFEDVAASTQKIKIPGTEYTFKLWRFWMSQEEADFKYDITNRKYRANAKTELFKLIKGSSELTLAAIVKLLDEDYLPKEDPEWAKATTACMKSYLLEKLGDNGVLFYPSAPFPASYHYSAFFRPYNFGYWCLFNVLRIPCCQVPLGLDENGLPVGIQVAAAPNNDHLCIAVAKELEAAFGGWVPPS
ncbi:fatty-acid amide hydrolase 2-B-like [Prorops nasuta]|uniref:fatty-acid amide hydrolase 2-B-like n=1 Tax=Prorops nasuta TaxID=863751 RepID=UPI0034CFFF97